jgi:hypothetical protein
VLSGRIPNRVPPSAAATCLAAGKLPARLRGPANGIGHGAEGHLEDVVQDERNSLCGAQPLKHDQQGEPHAVIERDTVRGIGKGSHHGGAGELDAGGIVSGLAA